MVPLDEAGDVELSRGVVNDSTEVHRVSGDLEPDAIEVALNATSGRAWFADASVAAHMAHALETKASASSWVKNAAFDGSGARQPAGDQVGPSQRDQLARPHND